MVFAKVALFDTLRSIAFGAISGTFAAVGSAFTHPVRILKFSNDTDQDLFVSLDGVHNQDYVPAGGFSLYDMTTNHDVEDMFRVPEGTQVYVAQTADTSPTSGNFYITCIYGKGE